MRIRDRFMAWTRRFGEDRLRETPSGPVQVGQSMGDTVPCPTVGLLELAPAEIMDPEPDDGIAIGEWPDDPNAVPAWVLKCDARGAEIGIEPLRIRTRAQFEQAVELCQMQADCETAEYRAAVQFLAWMRSTNRCGTFSTQQLTNAWGVHCKDLGRIPASEAHMRTHLVKLAGVSKALQEAGKGKGRRNRPTIWTIAPIDVQHVEPLRRAA